MYSWFWLDLPVQGLEGFLPLSGQGHTVQPRVNRGMDLMCPCGLVKPRTPGLGGYLNSGCVSTTRKVALGLGGDC